MSISESKQVLDDYILEENNKRFIIPNGGVSYGNKHVMWVPTGMFHQKKYYSIPSKSLLIYWYLRSRIVRGKGKSDIFKLIKKEYYDRKFLACSISQRTIAEDMGWHRSLVQKWIEPLIELKIIKVESIDVGNQKEQTVYILGTRNNDDTENYLIDYFLNNDDEATN